MTSQLPLSTPLIATPFALNPTLSLHPLLSLHYSPFLLCACYLPSVHLPAHLHLFNALPDPSSQPTCIYLLPSQILSPLTYLDMTSECYFMSVMCFNHFQGKRNIGLYFFAFLISVCGMAMNAVSKCTIGC